MFASFHVSRIADVPPGLELPADAGVKLVQRRDFEALNVVDRIQLVPLRASECNGLELKHVMSYLRREAAYFDRNVAELYHPESLGARDIYDSFRKALHLDSLVTQP